MLKINSIETIGFVGESERLVYSLTCPLSRRRTGDRFYYKSSLYRVENPDDAKVRVVVFSAVDVFVCFDQLLDLVDYQKVVLYLTDVKKAKRMGFLIDTKRLSYILECPVVCATKSASGINRLLSAIHMVSQTPNFTTAFENPCVAKKAVVSFRKNFLAVITEFLAQIFINTKTPC